MKSAPLPINEQARLEALLRTQLLDSPPEPAFDDLVRLASEICGTPTALITLVDSHRQWFKAKVGIEGSETSRDVSFCAHAIHQPDVFTVHDAAQDDRFADNPLVSGAPHIRFYAGMPIYNRDQIPLGTLCVIDRSPRDLTPAQNDALKILSRQVTAQIELRASLVELAGVVEKQQKTESALKSSQVFYHSLVETIPQNLFRKDRTGRFTFANRRLCRTLGKSIEEIVGKSDFDFFPAESARKYQADDQRVMETGEALDTTEENVTPDGLTRSVHVLKTPLYDARGKIEGLQGIFWDITERKKTEEALAHERELLNTLIDSVPDNIYFKDRQSRFVKIGRALAETFRISHPSEAVGKTDFDFFDPTHARAAFADEQQIIRTGEPIIGKTEREVAQDGSVKWILTTKMPLRDHNGGIIGTFGISKDITPLKEAESVLAEARDAALESARLKSEFLANMSHEIRTPMNGVIGMTSLLQDTELTREQREFVDTIASSADALLSIINDILDFSKIEAGKIVFETIDFNLREAIESSVELLAPRAQEKKLELTSFVPEDVSVSLRGDPGRLRQVLTNLVGNAVKFTEKGDVLVRVSVESNSETDTVLRFEVQDTGIGIPTEAQPRIFQAFTQADGSMTRRYGGTGLGLAISRQLVEMMGGTIGFNSEPGRGSTFYFTARFEKQPVGTTFFTRARAQLNGQRVLIVDDNKTNRQILLAQTTSWKMTNAVAGGAVEALSLLRENAAAGTPFHLALLDLQMPDMDGLALARAIKAEPSIAATRLVMLTSLGQRLDAETMQASGLEHCLVKPLKQAQLFDCLSEVVTRHGSAAATAGSRNSSAPSAGARSLRVLLAEDNRTNQLVALKQLERLGHQADVASTGLEVLAALKTQSYDVILMDCQMPQMDGFEATRQIRAGESADSTRHPSVIIAMTANAMEGDRERCLSAGMDDYISKPVNAAALKSLLQKWTSDGPAARAAFTIDLARLNEFSGDDPEAFRDVVTLYLEQTSGQMAQLRQAIAAGETGQVERLAHTIRGSSATCGFDALIAPLQEIELRARQGSLGDVENFFATAAATFEKVRQFLIDHLQSLH